MSQVIAIKYEGFVYMAADTMVSVGSSKWQYGNHHKYYKIHKFKNGILVGTVGSLSSVQDLVLHELWEKIEPNIKLTKQIILNQIVNPVSKDNIIRKNHSKNDEGTLEFDMSYIVAKDDQLFMIFNKGEIMVCEKYACIGAGSMSIHPFLKLNQTENINNQMIRALIFVSHKNIGIHSPFTLIDTKNLTYSIVEEKNYDNCTHL
jgi:ATP-dependent protease HslVU (ClpYQ) peptidase subunit